MRLGSRQNAYTEGSGHLARLALSPGTDKADLVRGAVQALLAADDVDRAGVWIDEPDIDAGSSGMPVFRGVVSERGGAATPSEWDRLSLEALPWFDPLAGGRTVQQDLDGTPEQLMLGALLELRRAVWAPVESRGCLRGVLLAGTRRKRGVLPLSRVEAFSAELALAIELEEERRLARQRQADLNISSRLLAELAASGPIDSIFTRLVDGCTEAAPGGDGLGAVFAILRTRGDSGAHFAHLSRHAFSSTNGRFVTESRSSARGFTAPAWQSGDSAWLHAMNGSHLASIWQRAEDARNTIVVGSGSGLPWPRADVTRIVVVPLFASREPVGTLVAGLRPGTAGQRGVERLEFRSEVAATALALRQCNAALLLERKRQQAILDSDPTARVIVETGGRLVTMSRSAQELLRRDTPEAKNKTAEQSDTPRPTSIFGLISSPRAVEC